MILSEQIIQFAEKLTITVGTLAGQPFEVQPFQRAFIEDVYHRDEDGKRPVRLAILSGARKIGKSTFSAVLALVHLVGPMAEPNGKIIVAANSVKQADAVFDEIMRFVSADPDLQALITIVPSKRRAFVKRSDITGRGSIVEVIATDGHTAHGSNPSLFIMDELGQAKKKGKDTYEALASGQKARHEPLGIVISTQNGDPFHFFSQMVERAIEEPIDSVVCHLYAADEGCDINDREQWKKAHPALGTFVSLETYEEEALQAAISPSAEDTFRKYNLNQKISLHAGLVYSKDWRDLADKNCALIAGEDIILSLDMSSTKDLTSLTAISMDKVSRVGAWFWKPADQIADAVKTDRFAYDHFAREGLLETCPGRAIDPEYVYNKIAELAATYNVRALVLDPYMSREIRKMIEDRGPDIEVVEFRQGWRSMAPAINSFERDLLNGNICHPDHPILNFCVLNAVVKTDSAGNRVLDKSAVRMRIDGAVTLVMAIGHKNILDEGEAPITNPFEDDDFSILTL